MISVLTMTYQRHHVLEEAIQSFLLQNFNDAAEMVILNDSPQVKYTINHPNVRIINYDTRFSSISKKMENGYKLCKYNHIYRLDDDDLLAPNALKFVREAIIASPDSEVYWSKQIYFFNGATCGGKASNVNNGNFYKRSYLDRITFNDESFGEDVHITYGFGGKPYTLEESTMCYRWGGQSFHISSWGAQSTDKVLAQADRASGLKESGIIELKPNFKHDYWSTIQPEFRFKNPLTNQVCEICSGLGVIKRTQTLNNHTSTKYVKCLNCDII